MFRLILCCSICLSLGLRLGKAPNGLHSCFRQDGCPVDVQRINDRTLVVRLNDGLLSGLWFQVFRDPAAAPLKKGYTLKLPNCSISLLV